MFLRSAHIRNYRVHRDCAVRFDGDLVLVHGPNESGKSTLAEAIHRALFLKARGTTSLHAAMESDTGGTPEVEVAFDAGGERHRLAKTFGRNGAAVLETEGRAPLHGDGAEERLAQLLGVEGSVSGGGAERKMERRWAHLWVWQGKSSGSPLASLEESRERLRDKLQAKSGQDILSSPTDNAVIDALQEWANAALKAGGQPRKDSELGKAEDALAEAQAALERKRDALDALAQAADEWLQAEADRERHARSLEATETRLKTVRETLKQVAAIRERLKEKTGRREAAQKKLEELQETDRKIREMEEALKAAREAAEPGDEERRKRDRAAESARTELDRASRSREQSSDRLQRLRAEADAWQAHLAALREARNVETLAQKQKTIRGLREQRRQLREKLAPLEAIADDAVDALRKAEREAEQSKARLEAYALEIEVVESDRTVRLDDDTVAPGEKRNLSRSADLKIGEGAHIRLSPGGAENLENARQAAADAAARRDERRRQLAVPDLDAAEAKRRQRESHEKALEKLDEQLAEEKADSVDAELDEAQRTRATQLARRDAFQPENGPPAFPDDLAAAERAEASVRGKLAEAQDAYQTADKTERSARETYDRAEQQRKDAQAEQEKRMERVRELESRLNFALETSGDADARSRAINEARAAFDQAKSAEQSDHDALEELGAEQLEIEAERLDASSRTDREKLREAENRKIDAQARLKSSGSDDPEREVKEAEAKVEQFEKRRDALRHQTDVRLHLLERLKSARQATTAALAKPLEDAVAPYLRILFGECRPRLHWADDGSGLESFELDRTNRRHGVHRFEQLSHGTREQVALALRLAMAELLAADHDGRLPLVLDDAFTHADPDRLEKLKSLLYRAGAGGNLQICLLTCHPESYSGLSAGEVGLTAPAPRAANAADTAPADASGGDEPESRPAQNPESTTRSDGAEGRFLEALRAAGGRSGNITLQKNLGWDDATYAATRDALVANGAIVPGKGRGGSVRLPDDA